MWGIDPTAAGSAREEAQLHESQELSRAEESRAACSTAFQEVAEERDQIGLRERDRIYQAYAGILGLRMESPPAPKPGREILVAGRGGVKAPPPWQGDQGQNAVHVIQSIEQAPNLAEKPRSVAMMRDSHERMNDARRIYGFPWMFWV